jgi:redox-sensitive bicupin YhaK (pirin superfamily)
LPAFAQGGVDIRVIMGSFGGHASPVTTHSPTLYLDCRMPAASTFDLSLQAAELAAYVVSGAIRVDQREYAGGVMVIAARGRSLRLRAERDSRVMVIGGDPVGERHIWWNFVASSKARIENAKTDWRSGRFDPVPGETEFIPLPE